MPADSVVPFVVEWSACIAFSFSCSCLWIGMLTMQLASSYSSVRFKIQVYVYMSCTVYPKKYAHGFCFAVLCCGNTLTDSPISIRLTSLALWQSNDCPSASKATLMNMEKYFMWIHYERLHNHNKAKHNKTVCIFLGIYCKSNTLWVSTILIFHERPIRFIHSSACLLSFLWQLKICGRKGINI